MIGRKRQTYQRTRYNSFRRMFFMRTSDAYCWQTSINAVPQHNTAESSIQIAQKASRDKDVQVTQRAHKIDEIYRNDSRLGRTFQACLFFLALLRSLRVAHSLYDLCLFGNRCAENGSILPCRIASQAHDPPQSSWPCDRHAREKDKTVLVTIIGLFVIEEQK